MSERTWTDTRVECLKSLWADGLSASQIAAEIGGITRNSVISKVHRLGLAKRGKTRVQASIEASERRRKKVCGRKIVPFPKTRAAKPAQSIGVSRETSDYIPVGQRRTLMQLTAYTCRWPVGDQRKNDLYFCGALPVEGLPYCACHCRKAYDSVAMRRAEKKALAA